MANAPTVDNVDAGGQIGNSSIPIHVYGDTVDTSTKICDTPCVITAIVWYGTTQLHLLSLVDADDNVIFKAKAAWDHEAVTFCHKINCPNGLYVDDLDGGSVLIYLEK